MMRKILAVLLIICAGLGLVLCIFGLLGAWIANTPLTNAVTSAVQVGDEYLTLAGNTTAVVGDEIGGLQAEVDELERDMANITPETRAEIGSRIANAVQTRLGPPINMLRTTLATLRAGLIALNRSLESANRIPGVNLPTLTDELQVADQRLGEISNNLTTLTASAADVSIDGSQLESLLSSISDQLVAIEDLLYRLNAQIVVTDEALVSVGAAAPGGIDVASFALSVLALLFGAGQVCLILKGVEMLRTQA